MADTDDGAVADAFDALADETCLGILRALVRADELLLFSGLRERTGVRDSGRFDSHLDGLLGGFVERRDGRHVLTEAARERLSAASDGPEFEVRLASPW